MFSMRAHSLPEVTGAQPEEGFAESTKAVLGASLGDSLLARLALPWFLLSASKRLPAGS